MKVLLDEAFGKVYVNDQNVLVAEWKGFLKLDKLKPAADLIMDYIAKNKITKHVSDHKDLKILSNDVIEYIGTQFFPGVQKLGLKKVAAIVAQNVFAEMSAKSTTKDKSFPGLDIQYFGSSEDGLKWLNS